MVFELSVALRDLKKSNICADTCKFCPKARAGFSRLVIVMVFGRGEEDGTEVVFYSVHWLGVGQPNHFTINVDLQTLER